MQIPSFDNFKKIAEDSVTEVWQAHQSSLDRMVALKVLKPKYAADQKDVDLFVNEARLAAKLKRPHLAQIFDVGQHEQTFYIVFEFVEGQTLKHMMDSDGPLPPKRALRIIHILAESLAYAWETSQLTHRYLHPQSILIDDQDGTVKLTDLGVSKPTEPTRMLLQLRSGSFDFDPHYLSPEQANCSMSVDFHTDMYAAGAILYHMLTGQPPFADEEPSAIPEKHRLDSIPNPRDANSSITAGIAQLLAKLMAKNPSSRYKSWTEVADEIGKLSSGRVGAMNKGGAPESTIAPAKKQVRSVKPSSSSPSLPKTRIIQQPSAPVWAHALACSLLVLAWFFIAFHQIKPAKPAHIVRPPVRSRPTPTRNGAARKRPKPRQPRRPATTAPKATVAATNLAVTHTPEQEVQALAQPSERDMFLGNIATFLLNEQLADAVDMIAREREYMHDDDLLDTMDELDPFIREIAKINHVIAGRFKARIGKEVMIKHNNRDRRVRIVSIEGDKVHAEMDSVVNGTTISRGVTFAPASLSATEREHWFGTPTSPETHAMKFLLLMWRGDPSSAAKIADRCGPLSRDFKRLAEARL